MRSLITFLVVFLSLQISAQVTYEGFDYTSGNSISGENGGDDWSAGWNATINGVGTASVSNAGLWFGGLQNEGNALRLTTADANGYISVTRPLSDSFGTIDSTILWVTVLLNRVASNGGQFYITPGGDTTAEFGINAANQYQYGGVASTNTNTGGTTECLTACYDFEASFDYGYLWVNPPPDSTPKVNTAEGQQIWNDLAPVGSLEIRLKGEGDFIVDEIRMGSEYLDVIPQIGTQLGSVEAIYFDLFQEGDMLTIQGDLPPHSAVSISNAVGQVLIFTEADRAVFDVSNYPKGMYFFSISEGDRSVTKPFMVK